MIDYLLIALLAIGQLTFFIWIRSLQQCLTILRDEIDLLVEKIESRRSNGSTEQQRLYDKFK